MVFNASHEAPPPHLLIFGIMRNTMHAESWGLPIDADREMVHQPHLNTTHSQTCPMHLRLIRSVREHGAFSMPRIYLDILKLFRRASGPEICHFGGIPDCSWAVGHRSMPCSLRHTCCDLSTSSSYMPFTLGDACLMALMSSSIVPVMQYSFEPRKMVSLQV